MTDFLSMTAQQVEGLPEAKAEQVLAAWVKAKRPELAQALTASASRPHAKLAKKALYRLQSSGVAVEPPKAPAASAPTGPAPVKNEFPAVLSMQLGTGERAFLFAIPVKGGGIEVFQGILSDEFGIAQFGSERANRNKYRKRMDELKAGDEARVMLVPFERMKLELGRAITLNERTKTAYGAEIEQALSRIGVTPEDPDFPIPPLEAGDAEGREAGAALHELFEVGQWLPSERDLAALTARVDAIRNGPLPLSDEQKATKVKALTRELAHEVFTPAMRVLYARRLVYTAEVIDAQQRPAEAAQCRAEARRLAHDTAPSRFAEQLFEKALPKASEQKPSIAAALGLKPPK